MLRRTLLSLSAFLIGFAVIGVYTTSVWAGGVPRMAKDELKGLLGNPDVIILDVHTGRDWDNSEHKIKGAVREEGSGFTSWADKYPKGKTLVLYCS